MSALRYKLILEDNLLHRETSMLQKSYTLSKLVSRVIKSSDNEITISLTDFTTVNALYITSTKPITVEMNSVDVLVDDFMLITLSGLTSLKVECSDETGAEVEVVLWGS